MYSERSKSDNRSAAVEIYYDYLGCKLEQRFWFGMFVQVKADLHSQPFWLSKEKWEKKFFSERGCECRSALTGRKKLWIAESWNCFQVDCGEERNGRRVSQRNKMRKDIRWENDYGIKHSAKRFFDHRKLLRVKIDWYTYQSGYPSLHSTTNVYLANMFEKLRLLVTLEMKVFHKSIYILQDEAMTETVDALIEDGSKFLKL